MGDERFVRARGGTQPPAGPARWFIFAGRELLLEQRHDPAGYELPLAASASDLRLDVATPLYLGTLSGTPCIALQLPEEIVPDGFVGRDLRAAYGLLGEGAWSVAGLAYQLLYWSITARFCSQTGHPTRPRMGEWAMECPACGFMQYPRLSPCVIVLIHDDGRILLTRKAEWPAGRYGLVAGFVEPGETLEECVIRETFEETGIALRDLRYVDSQPWPFPHQLMVGFTARYAGGEIVVDRDELDDAAWFTHDALPTLPPPLSIARRLIEGYLAAHTPAPS